MDAFLDKYRGFLAGVMRWDDLDLLWQTIRQQQQAWYLYAVGEAVPRATVSAAELERFVASVDELLRREHDEDYCGIVYVDDPKQPSFVKIYDPNNLGVVCGYSENPPLPGWVMSQQPPVDLPQAFPPTAGRRRWWQNLFS
jgi:hypothetical protein